MAGGVHPAVDHRLGRGVALGNVFTGTAEGDAEVADHLEGGAVDGAVVGEVAVVLHVLGLVPGYPGQFPVVSKGAEAVLGTLFVDQPDHLLLKAGDGGIQRGDVDGLARVDQVVIADLGIGAFDLADAHLVLDGDLP